MRDENMPYFDPEAVENLREIVTQTSAGIVITSSWREKGIHIMEDVWYSRKMPGILEGITPSDIHSYFCIRGSQILQWLSAQDDQNYNYVIIDDCNDFLPEQMSKLVRTNPHFGLTKQDAAKAIAILQGSSPEQ